MISVSLMLDGADEIVVTRWRNSAGGVAEWVDGAEPDGTADGLPVVRNQSSACCCAIDSQSVPESGELASSVL